MYSRNFAKILEVMTGTQPPEGRLIEEAREQRGLSQNAAAERVGLSGTRWRQIVYGRAALDGEKVTRTLARMARIVGASSEDLAKAGRQDIADALTAMGGGDPLPAPSDTHTSRDPDASLSGHRFYEPEFWDESEQVPAATLPVGWALLRNPMADEKTVMWILMFSPGTWTQLRLPADYTQQQVLSAFRDSLKYIDKEKADLI